MFNTLLKGGVAAELLPDDGALIRLVSGGGGDDVCAVWPVVAAEPDDGDAMEEAVAAVRLWLRLFDAIEYVELPPLAAELLQPPVCAPPL